MNMLFIIDTILGEGKTVSDGIPTVMDLKVVDDVVEKLKREVIDENYEHLRPIPKNK